MLSNNELLVTIPEIFLVSAAIVLCLYGAFVSTSAIYEYPALARNVAGLSVLSLFITLCLIVNQPFVQHIEPFFCLYCFQGSFIYDDFSFWCKMFVLISTASCILIGLDYFRYDTYNHFEFLVLILFSTCSMLLMISCYDLITMYLTIEFQSLCFYVLAASKRNSEFSTEAGLKYFVLGALSSGILLVGCSLIYGFTGATNFNDLAKISLLDTPVLFGTTMHLLGLSLGILLVAVGFLFKVTAVPFHMWAPDVYEGSPTFVTAFFSSVPKVAILALMLRFFVSCLYDPTWQYIFWCCSIASMILATFAAMAQHKLKRFLAYSSIANVGYFLIGLSCGTIEGIQSVLIALVIYVATTLMIFAVLLSLRRAKLSRYNYIADLVGLAVTNPVLAITIGLTMFSFAGIPPLAGFFSKFSLFFAALESGAYSLAFVGIITSVIGCFYYIRFVKTMYFETHTRWVLLPPIDRIKSFILGVFVLFTCLFCVYPSPLFFITHQAALCLCM